MAIAWILWGGIATIGLCVLLFLVLASTAAPGASMVRVVLIAFVATGICIGVSLWLMLRKSFVVGILLACLLIPLTFIIGIGLEEIESDQRGSK